MSKHGQIVARVLSTLCASLLGLAPLPSRAQAAARPPVTLSQFASRLPDFLPKQDATEPDMTLLYALEAASDQEKQAIVPVLLQWVGDPRPEVRSFALSTILVSGLPTDEPTAPVRHALLPLAPEYIAPIALHLLDENGVVRNQAFLALTSARYTSRGHAELQRVLVPLLQEHRVLERTPDPFFLKSQQFVLERTPPQERAALERAQKAEKIILLPAVGPEMLTLILETALPPKTEKSVLGFLDRQDQTPDTLSDCLHNIALTPAPEPIQDRAVTRVFQQNAMSVFLIQFLNGLQLTPEHLAVQRERLKLLGQDASNDRRLRHAAQTVAACWGDDKQRDCRPDEADFQMGDATPEQIDQARRMAEHP